MPRAVIFDLDGTLLDSVGDIAAAVNAVLAEVGLPVHQVSDFYQMVGEGAEVLLQRAVAPAELRPEWLLRYKALYLQRMYDQTRVYPGVRGALEQLTAVGVPLAVLSNKPHEATAALVHHYFPAVPWRAVAGQRPSWPRKPDPAAALDLCRELRVAPGQCWFVGDTAVDLQTARNAGMRALGVTWGFRPAEAATAAHVADDAAQMLQFLLQG
ncbi:MAG: HAD-IA family hydrolase [Deltaproteobacteria bacterium]|nr:HAD-IA family hydrolase [Deltaproteobacteria bacterium]